MTNTILLHQHIKHKIVNNKIKAFESTELEHKIIEEMFRFCELIVISNQLILKHFDSLRKFLYHFFQVPLLFRFYKMQLL